MDNFIAVFRRILLPKALPNVLEQYQTEALKQLPFFIINCIKKPLPKGKGLNRFTPDAPISQHREEEGQEARQQYEPKAQNH